MSFFAGWLTGDLPVLHFIVQGVVAVLLVWQGALETWPGWVGLSLLVVGWAGLVEAYRESRAAEEVMERALTAVGVPAEPEASGGWSWARLIHPFDLRHRGVERIANIPIRKVGRWTLKADVYRPRDGRTGGPVLVFVHGGGWTIGFRQFQGLPVLSRLASAGWVCISVPYRLSPIATFPDHLIDVKWGIAWARQHAHEYGGDPSFLAIHGNSAGAHLSALAALTPNDPRYQPGFEDLDTSVDACVPVYGPMDLVNENNNINVDFRQFFDWLVMKRSRHSEPDVFHEASPLSRLHADAPPFFLVHGSRDSLVPVEEGRHFYEKFKREVDAPVGFAEIPGGQHALDIFHSRRGVAVADGIVRYLKNEVRRRDS